jgi:uncharacterized protein YbaR (Trm112 family)/ubiquinone/menaquinone biosynthesis C-methylase UbiE
MNDKILNRLCCPLCRGELTLHSFAEESVSHSQHDLRRGGGIGYENTWNDRIIKEGILLCQACKIWYPIHAYVPVLLIFETNLHKKFFKKYTEEFNRFSEYKAPNHPPERGEKSIQETFTDEWDLVHGHELTFLYSLADLKSINKNVFLKWLEYSQENIKTVLNVGCGLGRESIALQDVMNDAEIFAIDLNFAIFRSSEIFRSKPHIHLIVASLFHLPFKLSFFDLVYSQGVIHHTYSTFEAFKSISSYVRRDGYLFIWIYGLDDHLVKKGILGAISRLMYISEKMLRPLVSRSPKIIRDILFCVLTSAFHPIVRLRVKHKEKWQFRNTNHDLRDWLSPMYAHRHSYNDVFEWFERFGFRIVDVHSPTAYRKLFDKSLWGIGLTGKKL